MYILSACHDCLASAWSPRHEPVTSPPSAGSGPRLRLTADSPPPSPTASLRRKASQAADTKHQYHYKSALDNNNDQETGFNDNKNDESGFDSSRTEETGFNTRSGETGLVNNRTEFMPTTAANNNNNKQLKSYTCTSNCRKLYAKCLQYIDKHACAVLKHKCWSRLNIQLVSEIISRDTLRIDSELLVVEALLSWMVTTPKSISNKSNRKEKQII